MIENDKFREECGIFGVFSRELEVAPLIYYGLIALQHRGQESAGIAVSNGREILQKKGLGLVDEVFRGYNLEELKGALGIGHVRYSTFGGSSLVNAQPLTFKCRLGNLSLAHNGNLVNAGEIREQLEGQGTIFQTTNDSEVIAHLLAKSTTSELEGAIISALSQVKGAYSLLIMTLDKLIAIRDPHGIRPLVLGKYHKSYVVASETCALDTIGAEFIREINPGEMVVIDKDGVFSSTIFAGKCKGFCSFEYIYFSRPDSELQGKNVHSVRKNLGKILAKNYPVQGDLVTGVPDSSLSAAAGFAEELKIPYEMGLVRNRYIGRTFIKPSQELRNIGVSLKLNPVKQLVNGKRVVMVDDSIVRGTTAKKIVNLLREAGAKEVHVRISAPPVRFPCHLGIDTSSKGELLANSRDVEKMREIIGADSLAFLTEKELLEGIGFTDGLCTGCFTGDYPVQIKGGKKLEI
ncbi:amidophosphoribosyltransferase [Anaerobranca californiensis DSM 14826]|uniref:Amidophosphoribosyltransferase n=1 Tax=Anaerobranca californiensis DSM 14826 TaxID=1120989 RepID=A0A1M6PWV4_9FIRM|nr:amidophosphoribosyltransferase [Anaerobranca californiensis]SHK12445.1 amidophosphoribosyltransferase [Anaerobranca californiensis DSM 14826]